MNNQQKNSNKRRTRSQLTDSRQKEKQSYHEKNNSQKIIEEQTEQFNTRPRVFVDNVPVRIQPNICPKKSNWNRKQKIKYLVFIRYYSVLPHWSKDFKNLLIYKKLSVFIKSRSPEQCKSFHLAIKRNINNIDEIVKVMHLQLQFEEDFNKLLERYSIEIANFQDEHKLLEGFQLEKNNSLNYLEIKKPNSNSEISKNESNLNYMQQKDYPIKNNIAENAENTQDQNKKDMHFYQKIYSKTTPSFTNNNFNGFQGNSGNFSFLLKENQKNLPRICEPNINYLPSYARKYFQNIPLQNTNIQGRFNLPFLPNQNRFNISQSQGNFPSLKSEYINRNNCLFQSLHPSLNPALNNIQQSNFTQKKQKLFPSQNIQPNLNQIQQKKPEDQMSSEQKKLTLNCHKHWINYMCAVIQLKKRKQSAINQTK